MRTTLTIEDEVLNRVRLVANRRQQSISEVVTTLLREALAPKTLAPDRTGLPTMPVQPGATQANLAIVNALRDEMP
jgi:hypothetical protein